MGPCTSNPLQPQQTLPYAYQEEGLTIDIITKGNSKFQHASVINHESAEIPMGTLQKQNALQTRINILNKILNQFRKVCKFSEQIRLISTEKARLHFQLHQYLQTIESLKEAILVFDTIYPTKKNIDYIGLYNNIGTAYGKLKKKKKARKYFITALNCYFEIYGVQFHQMLTILLTNLAIYSKKKKHTEKKEQRNISSDKFKKEKKVQVEEKPLNHQTIKVEISQESNHSNKATFGQSQKSEKTTYQIKQQLLDSLGLHEFKDGNFDAITLFNRILRFASEQNGSENILSAKVYHNIANQYLLKKQYAKSQQIYKLALKIKRSIIQQELNYDIASTQIALAKCYFEQQKYYQGLEEYQLALQTFTKLQLRQFPLYKEFVQNKLVKNIQKMIHNIQTKNYTKRERDLLHHLIQEYDLVDEPNFKWIIQSLKFHDYTFKL